MSVRIVRCIVRLIMSVVIWCWLVRRGQDESDAPVLGGRLRHEPALHRWRRLQGQGDSVPTSGATLNSSTKCHSEAQQLAGGGAHVWSVDGLCVACMVQVHHTMVDGKRVKCQVWDTAGQEKFHVITRTYYRGAHGIALIYDVTDPDSFKNVNYWMANIQTHADEKVRSAVRGGV